MKFVHSTHFLQRNRLRNIGKDIAEKIFLEADGHYLDVQTNTFVAVKNMDFQGKRRDVSLVYLKSNDGVVLVTVHPLKEHQMRNRINSGRWQPL